MKDLRLDHHLNGKGNSDLNNRKYDVLIVGAGPAGLFAALYLVENSGLNIAVLEKGPPLDQRSCPLKEGRVSNCIRCVPCKVLSGWGGAGAFSDGKLTITPEFGGNLAEYVGRKKLMELIEYVDSVYMSCGVEVPIFEPDPDVAAKVSKDARKAGLLLVPARIRHLGSDKSRIVLSVLYERLKDKIDIIFNTEVKTVLQKDGKVFGVQTTKGDVIEAKYIVLAPGREGASWMESVANSLGLKVLNNPVDIGVRVEIPAEYAEELTDQFYELKLIFNSPTFDDRVRTFCMCPRGEVVTEHIVDGNIITVNGHSFRDKKTDNTNFAILVSTTFTEPFKDPNGYGTYIARLANMLGGGVIVQRLGDLLSGRRSTVSRIRRGLVEPTLPEAMPGDLSFVFPYRHLTNIIEMLKALDAVIPGVNSVHTLLYGVEVKFYSVRLKLNNVLETDIKNLFAAGDGAGVTRGLIQSSASGIVVAEEILKRTM